MCLAASQCGFESYSVQKSHLVMENKIHKHRALSSKMARDGNTPLLPVLQMDISLEGDIEGCSAFRSLLLPCFKVRRESIIC